MKNQFLNRFMMTFMQTSTFCNVNEKIMSNFVSYTGKNAILH
jgi:hypothetical protein